MARMYRGEISLRNPGKNTKTMRMIAEAVASLREEEMRKRCVMAAHLAKDAIADNAPRPVFTSILRNERLERYYNKNPGYDIKMEAGASFSFILKLSTNRYASSQFKGYNPVWGMIVTNYGRRAIDVPKPSAIPVPTDVETYRSGSDYRIEVNKPYNHPKYGTGYKGRYAGMFVQFTNHVDAVVGTHWIEEALQKSNTRMSNVLAGRAKYQGKNLKESKMWSF